MATAQLSELGLDHLGLTGSVPEVLSYLTSLVYVGSCCENLKSLNRGRRRFWGKHPRDWKSAFVCGDASCVVAFSVVTLRWCSALDLSYNQFSGV